MVENLAQAMLLVRDSDKELVYLRYDREYEGWRDTAYELEVIAEFVYEPRTLMIYTSPHHTFIKRETLLELAHSLKPETKFTKVPEQLTETLDKQPRGEI